MCGGWDKAGVTRELSDSILSLSRAARVRLRAPLLLQGGGAGGHCGGRRRRGGDVRVKACPPTGGSGHNKEDLCCVASECPGGGVS